MFDREPGYASYEEPSQLNEVRSKKKIKLNSQGRIWNVPFRKNWKSYKKFIKSLSLLPLGTVGLCIDYLPG